MDPDADSGRIIAQLLVLLILTLVNAFFAGAEMAVVSVNKNKIRKLSEEGNQNAALIQTLLTDSTRFLSTIQVAITFAGFFSSASAATGISKVLEGALKGYGIPFSQNIAMVTVTILLSYVTLVFGELVPKRIALQKAEAFSLWSVRPIYVISKMMSPFIRLLSLSTNLILKLFGMNREHLEEEVSEEEIKALLETGSEAGVFNQIETDMINSIFSFDDKLAKEIMVPRKDVYAIDIADDITEYLDELIESRYSKVPVYEEDIDHIVGVVNIKDIMKAARAASFEAVKVKELMKPPYFVHTAKNADELFCKMQADHQQMAILIDEYGGTAGIVTIEDLLEEIVGELNDEYDVEPEEIKQMDKCTYEVLGTIPLHELNEELHLSLESDNYDTLSGYMIEALDCIPKAGDNASFQLEEAEFKVMEVEGNRIAKVHIKIIEKQ